MEFLDKPKEFYQAYRKSWLAYLGPLIELAIFCAVAYGCFLLKWDYVYWQKYRLWIVAGLPVIGLFLSILQILNIRSVFLYTNEDGVWVFSGIFPWSKGTSGVKWQDLDDARFFTGFFSWIFQTYKIRIGHRFTKESEIVLTMMWKGQKAVTHINEEMYRRNRGKSGTA